MIWNEKAECMEKTEKEQLQLERLQKIVKRAYENVPFYTEKFNKAGIKPDDIKTLKDIEKIPFTTKDDLRDTYPFGLFAVPEDEIVEIHSSSGTTGKPTVSGYTKNDLEIWGEIIARALAMANGEKNDRIQNAYGYGLFTGGFGIHHGALKFGASIIPISSGNTKKQVEILKDFQSTILTCTPSYALYLAENLEKQNISLDEISLKSGIFGAEMWSEDMRKSLEEKLGILALNIYGLTEIMGPGVAIECSEQNGLHVNDDYFYPEIVNPKTGKVLNNGERGELVLTTLTTEGMPIIRFKTKDLTSLMEGNCHCGRTTVRIDRITGRTDDMLKIKGVKVFPSQIEKVLYKIKGVNGNYQIIVTREHILDEIEIKVELSQEAFTSEISELQMIEKEIKDAIKTELGIRADITLCEPESLPRFEGKSKKVIDKRNLN